MNQPKLSPLVYWIQYTGFLFAGIIGGIIGPLIPSIKADLNLNYTTGGLVFSAQAVGSVAVLLAGGFLLHFMGKRLLIALGGLACFAGLVLGALAGNYFELLAGNALIGVGVAFFDMGISTLCLDANPEGKGKALNLLHFFFGAGAVIGPLVALGLGGLPSSWRIAFAALAVVPLVPVVFLLFTKLPPSPPATIGERFAVYKSPLLWFGALTLCIYCGVEWGVGVWFPSFWLEALASVPALGWLGSGALATSLFWLTFSIGRFLVGTWADKWGFRTFLLRALLATLALCGIWVFLPHPLASLVIVLVLGFLIAGLYPTFVALISQPFPASNGQIAPFLSIFASVGSFLWPPLIGVYADAQGIRILPWAELILTALMLAVALATFHFARKATQGGK